MIQIPNVPSKNRSRGTQTVVLMYRLEGSPDLNTRFNFSTRTLRKLLGWFYGPSNDTGSPQGSQLAGCCSHVMTALGLGFCFSHNPHLFKPKHHSANLVDIRDREQDVASRLELQRRITSQTQKQNRCLIMALNHEPFEGVIS